MIGTDKIQLNYLILFDTFKSSFHFISLSNRMGKRLIETSMFRIFVSQGKNFQVYSAFNPEEKNGHRNYQSKNRNS